MQNTPTTYLKTIESLLEDSQIEAAIDALLKFVDPQTQTWQEAIQQSGNFQEIQRSRRLNLIDFEEYTRSTALVRYALLEMIRGLRKQMEKDAGQAPQVITIPAAKPPVALPLSPVPKFVVVYDLADSPQCQLLNKHLNVLKFTKKIRVYNVQEAVGDLLVAAETELAEADYLLVLVTVNIFNSPEWFDLVSKALEQGRRVIPILIEKADYDGTGLEKLRSLPSLGRAVSDFPNQDAAYADIVTELRKLLPK